MTHMKIYRKLLSVLLAMSLLSGIHISALAASQEEDASGTDIEPAIGLEETLADADPMEAAPAATVRHSTGSGSYVFDGVQLTGESGVLLEMTDDEPDAVESDALFVYSRDSELVRASFTNGVYRGSLYNNTGLSSQPGDKLSVTIGEGALLNGDIALAGDSTAAIAVTVVSGGVWVVNDASLITDLTVEKGGVVYGELAKNEDGTLFLSPSAKAIAPGIYGLQAMMAALTPDKPDAQEKDAQFPHIKRDTFRGKVPTARSRREKPDYKKHDDAPSDDAQAPAPQPDGTVSRSLIINGQKYPLNMHVVDGVEYAKLSEFAAVLSAASGVSPAETAVSPVSEVQTSINSSKPIFYRERLDILAII